MWLLMATLSCLTRLCRSRGGGGARWCGGKRAAAAAEEEVGCVTKLELFAETLRAAQSAIGDINTHLRHGQALIGQARSNTRRSLRDLWHSARHGRPVSTPPAVIEGGDPRLRAPPEEPQAGGVMEDFEMELSCEELTDADEAHRGKYIQLLADDVEFWKETGPGQEPPKLRARGTRTWVLRL